MKQNKDYELMSTQFSDYEKIEKLHYYKKKMQTKIEDHYYAHVFFTDPMSTAELSMQWKRITALIAVRCQSEVEKLIERSNFYLCFFVNDEPDSELLETIEGDEFCARKYIFKPHDAKGDLDNTIEIINEKLFSFSSTVDLPASKDALYVDRITLSNFRAYENTRDLDFRIGGKEASLVLIYAKNGVGKTSIFDGLEFLFKGEVDRISKLEKTNKKSQSPSATLHNLRHKSEEAFVSATLSDNQKLVRRVQNLGNNNKNDLKHTAVRKNEGKDFIGPLNESSKWNEIILPHDRIDGFTTVKSPEEVYNEWIRHSNLQPQSDLFLATNKALKMKNDEVTDINKKKKEIQDQLSELAESKEAVQEIIKLINEFNYLKNEYGFPKNEDLSLSLDDATGSYDLLINTAKSYERQINDRLENQIVNRKNELGTIIQRGDQYYEDIHRSFNSLMEMKNELEKALEIAVRYEQLAASKLHKEKEQIETEKSLEDIRTILKLGGDTVVRQAAHKIDNCNTKKNELQKALAEENKRIQDIDEKLVYSTSSIMKSERAIKETYPTIISLSEKYRNQSNIIDALKKAKEKYTADLAEKSDYTLSKQTLHAKLRRIQLPQMLSELDFGVTSLLVDFVENERISAVENLKLQYVQIKSKEDTLNTLIIQNIYGEDELGSLIRAARNYIRNHAEICDCPLCGNHYDTNKELLKVIESHNTQKQDNLQEQLKDLYIQADSLQTQYEYELTNLKEKIEAKDKELLRDINDSIENENVLRDLFNGVSAKLREANLRLVNLKNSLMKFGIAFEDEPTDAIERWYLSISNRLNAERIENDELNSSKANIINNVQDIIRELKETDAILESTQKSSSLRQAIAFMATKTEDWSAEDEKTRLLERIKDLKNDRKQLEEEMNLGMFVDKKNSSDITQKLSEVKSQLEGLWADEEIYKKYYSEGSNALSSEFMKLDSLEQQYKQEIDLLLRITEENSARSYFGKYEEMLAYQEDLDGQLKAAKKAKKELGLHKDKLKKELEEELSKYFNQPVMSNIYRKIDPHRIMKNVRYAIEFSDEDNPQLYTCASDGTTEIRPEWYFSTAQLNTLVFSSFFGRALKSDLPLKTIFIDDPIAHFDDMNILGFADLLRCLIMETPFQFVLSTHDRKIFDILRRKLPENLYRAKYIEL